MVSRTLAHTTKQLEMKPAPRLVGTRGKERSVIVHYVSDFGNDLELRVGPERVPLASQFHGLNGPSLEDAFKQSHGGKESTMSQGI